MWEQVKEDFGTFWCKRVFLPYAQGLILSQSFHLNLSNFLIETCDLHNSFLLGATWTLNCNKHGYKLLLWGSYGWQIEVTFQTIGTYGQGDGPSLGGSYLCLHKTLLVCDPILGLEFLKQIQIHYNMNSKLEMFTKKLQMLASTQVTNEQKVPWLKF